MIKVSVLMPSFNYARYLPFAIEAVLSQSYADLELIIVDDCSTDNSREIAQEWKRRDNRIVLLFHDVNRGLAATRNSGLALSKGEFIAFCDADDIWLPHKLALQVECLRECPETGLVHSDSTIVDAHGVPTGQRFSSLIHAEMQKTGGNVFDSLCRRNFLCVPTVMLRREALHYSGGFDERLRSLEDWVCWTKVARRYDFHYFDAPLAQYRIHRSGLSSDTKNMAYNRVMAIRILLESVVDIPREARARMLYSLGMSHLEIGAPRAAAGAFAESIEADATQVGSWVRCCQSLVKSVLTGRDEKTLA